MKSNKDVIIQYSKTVWNDRDLSIIDKLLTPHAKIRSPMKKTMEGADTMHDIVERWLSAFPNLSIQWDEFVEEGETVVSRWTATGTHLGGFFDTKPTYKEVTYSGVTIYKLLKSKIVDYWALVDIHAILSQLDEYDSIEEALES